MKTKKNIKKCMTTFAEPKIKYWTADINKQIKKLDKKKLTSEENKKLNKLKKERNYTQKLLKKSYKLGNCNVNCKDTILEPGLPGKLPAKMLEEYKDSKLKNNL